MVMEKAQVLPRRGPGLRRRIRRIRISRILLYLCMLLLVLFTMLPLIYIVVSAFKPLDELFVYPPRFYVKHPTLQNFSQFFKAVDTAAVPFSRNIFNSLFTSVASVAGTVFAGSAGAYALSKLRLPGSGVIFSVIVAALMFSPHVTQIPTYMVVNSLGMINTYWALIIPKIATAYSLFLIKQFCDQLPDSLLEAAKIDSAGEWTIYTKIVMPLLKPAITTVVVQSFITNWNDYFSPLIFISDQAMKPLTLALQLIGSGGSIARTGAMAAATLITSAPTIILFVLMQSRITQTMAYSGIKG